MFNILKNTYDKKCMKSDQGTVAVEFIIVIPLILTLFMFGLEMCSYWGQKYKFRLDVYYLTRAFTISASRISIKGNGLAEYENENQERFDRVNTDYGRSLLVHKDVYGSLCNLSNYDYEFELDCKYRDKIVYINATKNYKAKFFFSRPILDFVKFISSVPVLQMKETHSLKIDRFLEDNNMDWSGSIPLVTAFGEHSVKKWIKKMGELSHNKAMERAYED